MGNTADYYRKQREFHIFVGSTFYDLTRFKKEGETTAFNTLLLKAMPGVKQYVQKRLKEALIKGQIDIGKYKADDFIDQLFIEVYDHFEEVTNKKDLHPWLFKKADELLENTLVEEEFDTSFFENIDDYSKPEWDAMEEKFSTDGDGDLVMLEELDDISYHQHDDILNPIFADDNAEFTAQLDKELGAENIRKHTDMVLSLLPKPMRKAFEFSTEHQFELNEIAQIQNRTVQEVQTLLETARKSLQASFFNRYKP